MFYGDLIIRDLNSDRFYLRDRLMRADIVFFNKQLPADIRRFVNTPAPAILITYYHSTKSRPHLVPYIVVDYRIERGFPLYERSLFVV